MSDEEENYEGMPPLLGSRKKKSKRPPAAVRKLEAAEGICTNQVTHKRTRINTEQDERKPEAKEEEKQEEKPSKVPESTRSIVENDGLSDLICSKSMCRKCKRVDVLSISFASVGVTTIPELVCQNCGVVGVAEVSKTTPPATIRKGKEKVTDCAANVMCVLAFLSSGDGGTEAQRSMGVLGLPHVQSMEKSTFSLVEKATSPALWAVVAQALNESLAEEVKQSMMDDEDLELTQRMRR